MGVLDNLEEFEPPLEAHRHKKRKTSRKKNVCKRGHLLTEENSIWVNRSNGNRTRSCRICRLAYNAKHPRKRGNRRLENIKYKFNHNYNALVKRYTEAWLNQEPPKGGRS